jgi:hypothetical protein
MVSEPFPERATARKRQIPAHFPKRPGAQDAARRSPERRQTAGSAQFARVGTSFVNEAFLE